MTELFDNDEMKRAETLEQRISALISAAHWNGIQEGQAQEEAKAAEKAHHERLLELGQIYATARALLDDQTANNSHRIG